MSRRVLVMLACAACGDAEERAPTIDAISGDRIKLEVYRYDDGTRQVDASAFYDAAQHTRCVPRRWIDGEQRCVPIADEAVYRDAACTDVVGLAHAKQKPAPTHFLGFDWTDGVPVPARLYRAGDATTAITAYYLRQDGACAGPLVPPSESVFYAIDAELAASAMPVVDETELGAGRLALHVLRTVDGMQLPVGLRDRALDLPCAPSPGDYGAVCEPVAAVAATRFVDSNCTTPAALVASGAEVPAAARVVEPTGCASYFALGAEVSAPLYRRDAGACVRASLLPGQRAFTLAAPLELARLDRTIDSHGNHRLAPVTLEDPSDPALRFTGDRLVDRAIRSECAPAQVGDTIRCVPATLPPATTLYTPQCLSTVPVVELPERTCSPISFASASSDDGQVVLRAVGDPVMSPLFQLAGGGCMPYTPAPGRVVRDLGPPLPADTFVGAVKYGER